MFKIYTTKPFNLNNVGINDCDVGLSEIEIKNDHFLIPRHIYEDNIEASWEKQFYSLNIGNGEYKFDVELFVHTKRDWFKLEGEHMKDGRVKFDIKYYDIVQEIRRNSYNACQWYKKNKIPTAVSMLAPIDHINRDRIAKSVGDVIKKSKGKIFIKTCRRSAKDIKNPPVYENIDDAVADLEKSCRIDHDECHLFFRQVRHFVWEVRCFWYLDKLRAVSSCSNVTEDDRKDILRFFKKYRKVIPYHCVVIDIGKNGNTIELIEYNPFGPDMHTTAGNFSWYEDINILLGNSKDVVFRS